MKLKDYAKQHGIKYRAAWNRYKAGKIPNAFKDEDKLLQSHETYKALPARVSQQVLRLLDKNWLSFFKSIKDWKRNPDKYSGRAKLPKYKHKENGRNILIYTI